VIKSEFQEAMHLGLGRAILYARDNDVQPFRDVILDACIHSRSYDPDCEGTHSDFIYDLVELLPDRAFYRDEVLKALPSSEDDWDAVHRYWFAASMALDGDERAKKAIYENFPSGPEHAEGIGTALRQIDGIPGFLFAASKIGSVLISDPDAGAGWLLSDAIEAFGEEEAKAALLRGAASDPAIEAYRLRAEALNVAHSSSKLVDDFNSRTYEQLRPHLSRSRARLSIWGKNASTDELERAAHGLLTAQTPEEQFRHLQIFPWRPFPLDPSRLIELSLSEDERMGCAAADALTQITHPGIRETAFRLIRDRLPGREHAIDMLSLNIEPGDHELALSWFESESDQEARHRMQMDLKKLWEDHPKPATEVRMLHALYEHGPCSLCRRHVVERLIALDALSESMRAECAYDANEEVRALVAPNQASS